MPKMPTPVPIPTVTVPKLLVGTADKGCCRFNGSKKET